MGVSPSMPRHSSTSASRTDLPGRLSQAVGSPDNDDLLCLRWDHRLGGVWEFQGHVLRAVCLHQHHIRCDRDLCKGLRGQGLDFDPLRDTGHDHPPFLQMADDDFCIVRQKGILLDEHVRCGGHQDGFSLSAVLLRQIFDEGGLAAGADNCDDHSFSSPLRCKMASRTPPAMHRALSEMVKQLSYSSARGSMSAILKPTLTG